MPYFLPRGRFVAEQQILPPPIQMQPITCSTVRPPAPSPVFSPSLMIPHTSFTSHQANTPVHLHQWPQQQVQQHRLYLQVMGLELVCEDAQGWLWVWVGFFLKKWGLPGQCTRTSSMPIVSARTQVLSLSRLALHPFEAVFSNELGYRLASRRSIQFFKHNLSPRGALVGILL